jgi:hypothetical protein
MSSVSTSLTVGFSDDNGDGELLLENGGGWVGRNSVPLIVRDTLPGPPTDLHLYCTTGEVVMVGTIIKKQYAGNVFQQQGEETLEVPDGATYDIKFALDELGHVIHPTEVSRSKGIVKFNMPWWGVVIISPYTKDFKLLQYTPFIHKFANGGEERIYGVVAALKNGRMVTAEVFPPTWGSGHDETEVYRVESQILINREGEWEVPNGWPDNPTYPNGATPPKPRVGVVSTRVHEVGMVTKTGLFWSRTYSVMPARPYSGDPVFKPKVSVVKGRGFETLSDALKLQAMEIMRDRGKEEYL